MKILHRTIALILVATMLIVCTSTAFAAKSKKSTAKKQTPYDMPYYIEVDIANQITTVYNTADNSIERQMICTTGMGSLTPRGTYIMPKTKYAQERQEWYYFPEFKIYAKYASRIVGGILFHSILFSSKSSAGPTWASNRSLGSKASHGCVRLRVVDAQWVAENCLPGTQVRMFDDGERNNDLRALLKISTFIADEVSYEEFLAGSVTLSNGVHADTVTELQENLNRLGYDCGKPDGHFGSNTEKAVRAWQRDYGYEETGVVSPALFKAISSAQPIPTPEPTPTPDISTLTGVPATVKTKTWLNVRSEADLDSKLITRLKNGKEVTVIYQEDGWSQIVFDNTIGYVSSAYLKYDDGVDIPTPTPEVTPEPTPEPQSLLAPTETINTDTSTEATVISISNWLNVRSNSKMTGKVLAKLHSKDKVTMIGLDGKWAIIELKDGTIGYVLAEYLNYDTEVFPSAEPIVPEGIPGTVTSNNGVNLRREPAEDGGLISSIANKTTVYIQEKVGNGWVKVYANGFNGYMLEEYITVSEDAAA